jgi:hypothetical protein
MDTGADPIAPASQPSAPNRRPRRYLPARPEGWVLFALGLALVGYGVAEIWLRYQRLGKGSLLGFTLVLFGVILLPYRFVGLVCGLALCGLGIYMFLNNYSTLQTLVVLGFGIVTVIERGRRDSAE